MPTSHTVVQGDSMPSIGFAYGFDPDTVWNHPSNAELKAVRVDPNVLLAGDVVVIPDKQARSCACDTGRRHRFQRKAVPAILRVRFLLEDRPRAHEPYTLELDGAPGPEAKTDDDGVMRAFIPPGTRQARVLFHDGTEVHELEIGHLDPIELVAGLQGRLRNLGFFHGAVDGQSSDALVSAIQSFQARNGLEPNGIVDEPTRAAVLRAYGE